MKDWDGYTAVMMAAEMGHEETLSVLLRDSRVDVNVRGNKGTTAMHQAALFSGKANILKLLLNDPRVDVNIKKDVGLNRLIVISRITQFTVQYIEKVNSGDIEKSLQLLYDKNVKIE